MPGILSDVEEKALFEAAKQAGARKVYFIPQSVAVALAMGFDDPSYDLNYTDSAKTLEIQGRAQAVIPPSPKH